MCRTDVFDNRLFLLQIAVIIGFSHLVAALFRKFGQPKVVGEMAAGIALGPTLFGLFCARIRSTLCFRPLRLVI